MDLYGLQPSPAAHKPSVLKIFSGKKTQEKNYFKEKIKIRSQKRKKRELYKKKHQKPSKKRFSIPRNLSLQLKPSCL